MPSTILVTGGAGYIGSLLVPALLAEGHTVRVLDNFLYRQTSLAECCANERFEVARGDVRDEATLRASMKGVDTIIPLAAIVGFRACDADPVAAKTTNFEAVRLLLSLRSSEQRILFPCTNSGYGVGENGQLCTEESPLRPISLYGITKTDAEKAILDAGNAISFRLATCFGMSARMRLDLLVNDFVYRAVTDRAVVIFEGHFKRNFVHVRDVVRAFLHGIRNFETMRNQVYNVGLSSANLSKLELCEEIRRQIPSFVFLEAPVGKDPDQRNYVVSNAKIEATGFTPHHSLQAGIAELIKGFRIFRNTVFVNG